MTERSVPVSNAEGGTINSMPRRTIVLRRSDGLGARLLAFLHAWRFARRVDADLHVLWPSLSYSFRDSDATDWGIRDLFAFGREGLAGVEFFEGPLPPPVAGRLIIESDPDMRSHLRFGIEPDVLFADRDTVECGAQRPLTVPGESKEAVAEDIRQLAELMQPSAPIQAALDAVKRAWGSDPYVAVHVRRGDVRENAIAVVRGKRSIDRAPDVFRSYVHRCPPIAILAEAARAEPAGHRVLCLSDTPEFLAELRKTLGHERCLDFEPYVQGLGPLQRALFEILLARRADAIHAGASAFVRLAAEMGHARLSHGRPQDDPSTWLHAFTSEVLDPAGVAPEDRRRWLEIYAAEWEPIRAHGERLRERGRRLQA